MPTVKEIIETLQQNYEEDDVLAVHIWSVEDVMYAAEEIEISITKGRAEEILDELHYDVDCAVGITWDSINEALI